MESSNNSLHRLSPASFLGSIFKTYIRGGGAVFSQLVKIQARTLDNSKNTNSDTKAKGSVTVSFSFKNPVRYSRYLVKPAYRCEGGGEVVVKATIDRAGKVLSAVVVSGGDECMRQTAISAAKGSTFDHNSDAPQKQEGTITYIFIPQ